MDEELGDPRYRAWEAHGLPHAAFGLEAKGLIAVGSAPETSRLQR